MRVSAAWRQCGYTPQILLLASYTVRLTCGECSAIPLSDIIAFYVSSNCTTRGAKRENEGKYAISDLPIAFDHKDRTETLPRVCCAV